MVKRFVPLALLLAFVGLVAWKLMAPETDKVTSQLVGRTVPTFALEPAVAGKPGLASADLGKGAPRMVNIFASWCVPCIAEAPLLDALAREGLAIDGIAVRDRPDDVVDFLAEHGDPFGAIGADPESAAMIALGAAGVPESFIVDGSGRIAYHHQGPLTPADLPEIRRQWEAVQ
ncbi:DsbE family thiol:disulfide interchange protein [Sphingomicrobium nitratireducens]|uniref:DsbE family thiol:disulfide interchange protein n=1 Tax=Sphingomicrobium nitratireducens TaxID=2964666 RepID=UPI002240210E|nr:DsbE family thiol:disulfide interchange protein [Sphingomicrobium nitratireducens]